MAKPMGIWKISSNLFGERGGCDKKMEEWKKKGLKKKR